MSQQGLDPAEVSSGQHRRLERPALLQSGQHSPPLGGSTDSQPKVSGVGRPVGWRLDSAVAAARPSQPGAGSKQPTGLTHASSAESSATGMSGKHGAAPDRLARLAQQRQRLAEQRARLAAGRSAPQTGQPAPFPLGQQPLAPAQTEPPAAAAQSAASSTDNAAPVRPNAALPGQGSIPKSEDFLGRLSWQAAQKDNRQEAQAAQVEGSQLAETSAAAGPAVEAGVTGSGVDGEGVIAAAPASSAIQDQELEHDQPAESGTSWVTDQAHTAAAGVAQDAGIPFGGSGASSGDIFGDDLPAATISAAQEFQHPGHLHHTPLRALANPQPIVQTGPAAHALDSVAGASTPPQPLPAADVVPVDAVKAAVIPFGRSESQASLGHSSRGPFAAPSSEDQGSFFKDTNDAGSSAAHVLAPQPALSPAGNPAVHHSPASEHHAVNGHQNGAVSWDTSSTGQASGDWSRRTAWGSSSSLATQYPHTMPISQGTSAAPPAAPARQLQHSRNPSWASSDHFSISSTPLPPPPAAAHWEDQEPRFAHNGTSAQPPAHWEQSAFSSAQPPDVMRPVSTSHQIAAPLVETTGAWEEGAEDGTDFFADTPSGAAAPIGAEPLSEPVPFAAAHRVESAAEDDADRMGPQPVHLEQNPAELAPVSSAGVVGSAESDHTTPFGAPHSQAQPFEWDAGQQAQPKQWSDQSQAWAASQGHSLWNQSNGAQPAASQAHSQWDQSSGAQPVWDTHAGAHWDHSQQSGVLPAGPAVEYGRQQWETQAPAQAAQWGGQPAGNGQQWGGSDFAYGSQTALWAAAHTSIQANIHEVPRTAEQAMRCPSGRPPVPVIAFGFGGLVVAMQPRPAPTMGGTQPMLALGPLRLMRMEALAATLGLQQSSGFEVQESVRDTSAELHRSFPGVLSSSTSKDKVLKYIAEREAAAAMEVDSGGDPAAMQLMWGVLRLLSQNRGSLTSPPEQAKAKPVQPSIEAQLGQLLVPGGTTGQANGASLEPSSAQDWSEARILSGHGASASDAEGAAEEMQRLLQQGRRSDALRVAVEAQLWGPAVLLARFCGEPAFNETATAMADAEVRRGTPLHALLSVLAGGAKQPSAETGVPAVSDWQGVLAILSATRAPGSDSAMVRLGDQLWASGNVVAAHVCYVLKGLVPAPFDLAARICLPGADHRSQPRTFASTAAIHRALVLDWARQQGPSAAGPAAAAALMPYRLILASRLAEYGQVEAASQQCSALAAALSVAGGKLPGGLLVTRSLVNELQLRLQTHAQAFHIPISHVVGGSLMSKAGKWLDRGLSKLIGVAELPEGVQAPDATRPPLGPPQQHRRANSQPGSPKAQPHRRISSAADMSSSFPTRPQTPQEAAVPAAAPATPAGPPASADRGAGGNTMESAASLTVRGLMSRVGSFTSLLGSTAAAKNKEALLGSENRFIYDEQLKQWREEGKPPPQPEVPLQPPPTAMPPIAPPLQPAGAGYAAGGSGTTPAAQGPPPPGSHFLGAQSSGVRSRYVDTLGRQPSNQMGQPPGVTGILPQPPLFTPPGAARLAAGSFFIPSAPAVSAAGSALPAAAWQGGGFAPHQPEPTLAAAAEQGGDTLHAAQGASDAFHSDMSSAACLQPGAGPQRR